jgi:RNA polymerase sigma-70 factor (ECF subfamily)
MAAAGVTASQRTEFSPDDDARRPTFAEMYSGCRADLVALCHRQLGPAGDAEAVAQEAFLRAWAALDHYSTARPLWPWMATIARRLCIDQLRRRRLEQARFRLESRLRGDHLAQPDEHVERSEEGRVALEALRRLNPRDQRLLGLREIDGWSIEQLAALEGMTLDAVRSALKRSRISLRQSYGLMIGGSTGAATG